MPEYWIVVEENVGGALAYRKLVATDDEEYARRVFDAIVAGDAYNRVILVEVKEVD